MLPVVSSASLPPSLSKKSLRPSWAGGGQDGPLPAALRWKEGGRGLAWLWRSK